MESSQKQHVFIHNFPRNVDRVNCSLQQEDISYYMYAQEIDELINFRLDSKFSYLLG